MRLRFAAKFLSELTYLREFARAIFNGELSQAQVEARMNQYAEGIYNAFWQGKQLQVEEQAQQARQSRYEERRKLEPFIHHCDNTPETLAKGWKSCPDYAAEGWKPLGYFPLPGQRSPCLNSCHCTMEHRVIDLQTGEIRYL